MVQTFGVMHKYHEHLPNSRIQISDLFGETVAFKQGPIVTSDVTCLWSIGPRFSGFSGGHCSAVLLRPTDGGLQNLEAEPNHWSDF